MGGGKITFPMHYVIYILDGRQNLTSVCISRREQPEFHHPTDLTEVFPTHEAFPAHTDMSIHMSLPPVRSMCTPAPHHKCHPL